MAAALLFDLDGTLLHSDALHMQVFIELYAERGRRIDESYYLSSIHGRHNSETFARDFPDEDPMALSDEKEARFRDRLPAQVDPMPGLPALLDRAAAEGWRVAVVTNAPRLNAEAMLSAIGQRARFDTLVIGDECARPKPDPLPYTEAMALLGARPQDAIAFEDSPSGTRAAQLSGAFTIGVRSSLPHDRLREAGAHASIADFADPALAPILDQRLQTGAAP
ncbi:HAD family hydrolase [Roseivivax sediminis]|uniref:Haloacid dehalogenase superfamily, subfamily IA, variant 3 with third motif having DD or ED n=1 Tax=Roseivivax sediminis TaxID=936889 RepID=A0A1I1WZK0_9RHOB|nr:HAD-IA family hydrolase [Roseivivax sediminis]SFE00499.1 haloacid dehalogenase superfamily, subfamily IA, variant 3 with third motif having DD or ED [Roseivivax sediminis]